MRKRTVERSRSVGLLRPDLLADWHTTSNGDVDPFAMLFRFSAWARSPVFVDVVGIDAEADAWLAGEVSRVLTVALALSHRLRECVIGLVYERSTTTDRDVMQIVAFVMDDQRDPRITADVGDPPAIPMSVESDVVLAKRVVDDDLAGRAVRPERRQRCASGAERNRRTDSIRRLPTLITRSNSGSLSAPAPIAGAHERFRL